MDTIGICFVVCILRLMTCSFLWQILDDWSGEASNLSKFFKFLSRTVQGANIRQRGTLFLRGVVFFGSLLVFQSDSGIIRQVGSAASGAALGPAPKVTTYFNFYAR